MARSSSSGRGRPARLRGFRIEPGEWRPLVVLGLLFSAQIGSMNVGTALTSAAHSTVLLNLYAVHTVLLAHFLIPGDRLTPRRIAGVLVAYAGIVMRSRPISSWRARRWPSASD